MVKLYKLTYVLVCLFVIGVLVGSASFAAEKEFKIAVVDVPKLYKDAPRVKQYKEQLEGQQKLYSQKLKVRSDNLLLSEVEVKELVDLTVKTPQTDADKARMKVLTDENKKRDDEKKSLEQTNPLNDDQKKRLAELNEALKSSQKNGEIIMDDYNKELQSKAETSDEAVQKEITEAIKKIADSSGYSIVIDKSAALFGGIDITDKVISNLERKLN